MDYAEALAYISATGRVGVKLGLERTRALLDALGSPDRGMRGVLVAGTNGKGSVCAMAGSILQQAGYRVGSMPKPHLQSYTERICVNGEPISEADFAALITELQPVVDEVAREIGAPTEFEMLTAAAIHHLRERGIDLLVCEVGLGGRLDSTNVLDLGVKVITTIALDHQQYLGDTVEAIAKEKAGIIRPHDTVLVGDVPDQAWTVIAGQGVAPRRVGVDIHLRAGKVGWDGTDFDVDGLTGLHTPLIGAHQAHNGALAVAASRELGAGDAEIRDGLARVRWRGRLEVVAEEPRVLIDSAHNPAAMRVAVDAVRALEPPEPVVVLLGVMADKDWRAMLALLPREWPAVFTAVADARALPPGDLLAEAQHLGRDGDVAMEGSAVALKLARARAGAGGMVVVLGSLYLAGEVRDTLGL